MKKKVVGVCVILIVIIFILMFIMVLFDNGYNNNIKKDIIDNTKLKELNYVNRYNNYYIVTDDYNLYLFDNEYIEIAKIDLELVHNNEKKYDIIYKDDKLYYMNSYNNKNELIIEYYDIYNYKMIDKIILGGK